MDWKNTCRVLAGTIAVVLVGYLVCSQVDWNNNPFTGMTSGSASTGSAETSSDNVLSTSARLQSNAGIYGGQSVEAADENSSNVNALYGMVDALDQGLVNDNPSSEQYGSMGDDSFTDSFSAENNSDGSYSDNLNRDNGNIAASFDSDSELSNVFTTGTDSLPYFTSEDSTFDEPAIGEPAMNNGLAIVRTGGRTDQFAPEADNDGRRQSNPFVDQPINDTGSQQQLANVFSGEFDAPVAIPGRPQQNMTTQNGTNPSGANQSPRNQNIVNQFIDEPLPMEFAAEFPKTMMPQTTMPQAPLVQPDQRSPELFSQPQITAPNSAVAGQDYATTDFDASIFAETNSRTTNNIANAANSNAVNSNTASSYEAIQVSGMEQNGSVHRASGIETGQTEMRSVLPANQAIVPTGYRVPESVAQKAAHHIEYGKSLARRGATHAARQEFYHGLRLVAQAMDTQSGGTYHTAALRTAISTLLEAGEFHVSDSETQMVDNVAAIVEAHTSNVITIEQAKRMTSIEALQLYYSSAQQNFIAAGGDNVVAAEALYCLGKLHSAMSQHEVSAEPLDVAKSILYHRSALACDQRNYRSANELGAMLARNGQADEAVGLFKQSLRIQQTPQAWNNLATVHQRQGQQELAARARGEYDRMANLGGMLPVSSGVQWLDNATFNESAPMEFRSEAAVAVPTLAPALEPRVSEAQEKDGFFERFKNKIR